MDTTIMVLVSPMSALGDNVVEKLAHLSDELKASFDQTDNEKWLADTARYTNFFSTISEQGALAAGVVLLSVNDHWDRLTLSSKSDNPDFKLWAEANCPNKDWKTLKNWMRVAEVFVVDAVKYNVPVLLPPKIAENGHSVPSGGIVFDPSQVEHSKLLAATARVKAGTMNDKLWSDLADPKVKVRNFLSNLHDENGNGTPLPLPRYRMVGSILLVNVDEQDYDVLEFNNDALSDRKHPAHSTARAIIDFLNVAE